MDYSVLIPVSKDTRLLDEVIAAHLAQRTRDTSGFSFRVVVVVNGPGRHKLANALRVKCFYQTTNVLDGFDEANPYPARNLGLSYAWDSLPPSAFVVLTDSDCLPAKDFHSRLCARPPPAGSLSAGATLTSIPDIKTPHFKLLKDTGFECYDGYTPSSFTVGSNMIITRGAYEKLGPMDEKTVSGGDGEYGLRAQRMGVPVYARPDLKVLKSIETLTLRGIIEKQIRRALCINKDYAPCEPHLVPHRLAAELRRQADILDALPNDLKVYPQFVDSLFKSSMYYGHLSRAMDQLQEDTDGLPSNPNKE